MKKTIALLLVLTLCSYLFAGCGGGRGNSPEKRQILAPGSSDEKTQDTQQTESTVQEENTDLGDDTSDSRPLDEGTISSLDEIKQNVIEAGYEIIAFEDMQDEWTEALAGLMEASGPLEDMEIDPSALLPVSFVDGFYIVMGDFHVPVWEYDSPETAQAQADAVNEAGYNVPIVNGRFMTCVDANKGVIVDDQQQEVLEKIMDAKAQVQEHWTDVIDVPVDTTDYKSAYALMENVISSMNTLMDQSLTKNNKEHPEGDPLNTDSVVPFMLGSIAMAFTAYFCEDEAYYESIASTAGMLGATETKMVRNAAHDYTITGKERVNQQPYEIHGVYDPATGSLRMVEKTGDEVTEFFEFVPLGDGKYAFQTQQERAIANFRNGTVESFVYTKKQFDAEKYDSESDSIYPDGSAASEEWVANLGEDSYDEYFHFDGTTIKINYKPFFGEKIKVEIPY